MLIESFVSWDVCGGSDATAIEAYEKSKIDELLCLLLAQLEGTKTPSEIRSNTKLLIESAVGIKEA